MPSAVEFTRASAGHTSDYRVIWSRIAMRFAAGRFALRPDWSEIIDDEDVRLRAGKVQADICNARQDLFERLGLSARDVCVVDHVK